MVLPLLRVSSSLGGIFSSCSPDFGTPGVLDRFGQIAPRVLFACNGYFYAGKVIEVSDKVRKVAAAVASIEQIVWVDVLGAEITLQDGEALWSDWLETYSADALSFTQLPFEHLLYIL